MPPIVDIHSHTFNASDLPTEEYLIDGLFLHGRLPMTGTIKKLIVKLFSRLIANHGKLKREGEKLDALLQQIEALTPAERASVDERPELTDEDLIADLESPQELLDAVYDELKAEEGEKFLEELQRELEAIDAARPERGSRSQGGVFLFLRYMRQYRYQNTRDLINSFPQVELFTPSVIDFGVFGLTNETYVTTPLRDQMVFHEKISILSVLGGIPGANSLARVHPFFTYNPETQGALELLKEAILERGFLGVKIYPSMGWAPGIDNPDTDRTIELLEFYKFCVKYDVPITTHSSPSGYQNDNYNRANHPDQWRSVLADPDLSALRINFGHFGMGHDPDHHSEDEFSRSRVIADLMVGYDNIYADTGNHIIEETHTEFIKSLLQEPTYQGVAQRLMFGTDWFMVSTDRDHRNMETRNQAFIEAHFGVDHPSFVRQYMGQNAMRFLGLDDPARQNYQRLKKWYIDNKLGDLLPSWLDPSSHELIELPGDGAP